MSYVVFARKWRPLDFKDVIGQEHITNTLKRAIVKDRVAHAYIFTGTRGVGKTTTARILARALNCDKGPTPDPCGTCESCQNIIKGHSFDVIEVDGASNNGVDNIRELRENVGYSSMNGKYRIFVIDEVHMLTKGAFNALLKTLEEPPKNVIFIFATTEPHKIPNTIHSRCQKYDFRRISAEQILFWLEHICQNEKIPYEKDGLALIARKGDGSMRDSLSLLDQVYSFCEETITEAEVRSVLGLVETEVYNAIMESIVKKEPVVVLNAVEETLQKGFDLAEFLSGFQEYLRVVLFARLPGVAEKGTLDIPSESINRYLETASQFSVGDLLRMSEILKKTENELKWSSFPRFTVETAVMKLVYLDSTLSINTLLGMVKDGKVPETIETPKTIISEDNQKKTPLIVDEPKNAYISEPNDRETAVTEALHASVITPVKEEKAEYSPIEKIEEVAAEPVVSTPQYIPLSQQSWSKLVDKISQDRMSLGTFTAAAKLSIINESSIRLSFPPHCSYQYVEISKSANKGYIVRELRMLTGVDYDIELVKEESVDETVSPPDTLIVNDEDNESREYTPPLRESEDPVAVKEEPTPIEPKKDSVSPPSVPQNIAPPKPEKVFNVPIEEAISREPIIKDIIDTFKADIL